MANPTNPADDETSTDAALDNSHKKAQTPKERQVPNPRDALIEGFQEQIDQARLEEEGLSSVTQITESEEIDDQTPAAAPKKVAVVADDPLKNFIIIEDGVALFKTKINGEEKLLPLDRVQQQVQKHEAADIRLQLASRTLKESQAQAERTRQEIAALHQTAKKESPPDHTADASKGIEEDAKKLVSVLFSGTPDEATAIMTEVLGKNRQAPRTPAITSEELVRQSAAVVRQELSAEDHQKDLKRGYQEFQGKYPAILADARLYNYTDNLTDQIAEDHPDWTPSQVLLDAGRQTEEWINSLRGVSPKPPVTPITSIRQTNKQKLRPLPTARVERVRMDTQDEPQTPAQVIEEIRKARGQG